MWSVNISLRMGILEEQDSAVVSLPWPPFFQPSCTFLVLTTTPLLLNGHGGISSMLWMSFMWLTWSFVFLPISVVAMITLSDSLIYWYYQICISGVARIFEKGGLKYKEITVCFCAAKIFDHTHLIL